MFLFWTGEGRKMSVGRPAMTPVRGTRVDRSHMPIGFLLFNLVLNNEDQLSLKR